MRKFISKIRSEENGAVTVDWVVLTALIVGLALGVILALTNAGINTADGIGAFLSNYVPTN
ncbi:hypothetical protein [Pseudosulfitobacter koreensis]|uniref:Flp pilus assembly protein, pilin Flp n=1 Tax=Pseudosulfitobacter koreensis TaxID=2968472 RepID=A0ABT1Z355_9RHOB|nr:hypothetical protein [Pseudosulfitobacter koreense]MCR8827574.1 hypothetical protein [Pseudosulfitobacter koreense]